jgi:hypothetical protein
MNELQLPIEFIGKTNNSGGYTLSKPRVWTENEIDWVLARKNEGFSLSEIAKACGRTEVSVSIKYKRLTKKNDTYNEKNRFLKYATNQEFLNLIQPNSVLDVYAGDSWYRSADVEKLITNDVDALFDNCFSMDAFKLLCSLYVENSTFDLVDLDPYGSAYECFDLSIKLARKAVVVSFGEWGHKRWKRLDYVRTRYDISSLEDFVEDAFIDEFKRVALRNKKLATPVFVIKYGNFLRVYFELSQYKTTEQWDKQQVFE